jgi:hypothetical protein
MNAAPGSHANFVGLPDEAIRHGRAKPAAAGQERDTETKGPASRPG